MVRKQFRLQKQFLTGLFIVFICLCALCACKTKNEIDGCSTAETPQEDDSSALIATTKNFDKFEEIISYADHTTDKSCSYMIYNNQSNERMVYLTITIDESELLNDPTSYVYEKHLIETYSNDRWRILQTTDGKLNQSEKYIVWADFRDGSFWYGFMFRDVSVIEGARLDIFDEKNRICLQVTMPDGTIAKYYGEDAYIG